MSEHWSVAIRPHLAGEGQVYFILPMSGPMEDRPFPVAMSMDRETISELCDSLNFLLSDDSEEYVIEHLYRADGEMNYSFYRDADKMGWYRS